MTRTFLIATVAALAITAPAQAQRGREGKGQSAERAQKTQTQNTRASRGEQRATVTPDRAASRERAQPRERASAQRAQPRQQVERRARPTETRAATRQNVERRAKVETRASNRPNVERRAKVETRASNRQKIERRARVESRAPARQHVERRAKAVDNRRTKERVVERSAVENRTRPSTQRAQVRERQDQPRLRQQQRQAEHSTTIQRRNVEQRANFQNRNDSRRATARALSPQRVQAWQAYAGVDRFDRDDRRERRAGQKRVNVGQRVNPEWYDNYAPYRYRTANYSTPDYYYRYDDDDGYLYQVRRDNNLVAALFPLLGGAYSVGRQLPYYYQSSYNVPLGYRSLYYDTPDYSYRYGDGAIYQVDTGTQLIQGIVALLTGQSFGIGQQMPLGYDVYNVPYAYRSTYYDTPDQYYRYDDGYIYGYDPRSRMIQSSYPLAYGGYAVGYPVPAAYPGYDYNVPSYYSDLYYDAPGYDYRYAAGGIYQVDSSTQLVSALVALVSGQNLGVGQRMPLGYDVYNVPYDYRARYYDTDDYNYRYADGYIYQVDPQTRVIQSVIDAIV